VMVCSSSAIKPGESSCMGVPHSGLGLIFSIISLDNPDHFGLFVAK
jgi:hypothetical protein